MMDVMDSSASDRINRKKFKRTNFNAKINKFSIEIYFMWFSALIFLAETIVDLWLVIYYFVYNELQYGMITLAIVIVPSVLCQIYSLWLLRTDNNVSARALMLHILLLGIPYRYHSILQKIAKKDKSTAFNVNNGGGSGAGIDDLQVDVIIEQIRDVNAIQTVNAIFQYFPQLLFQSFLIYCVHFKCLLTGVSAGLAGFSFLWHISMHFVYLLKRSNDDYRLNDPNSLPSSGHIIDHLTSSLNSTAHSFTSLNMPIGSMASTLSDQAIVNMMHSTDGLDTSVATSLSENYKNFEKPSYQTDGKNFMASKKHTNKNVEKTRIFGFNKRRPIYEKDDFDIVGETSNLSTVFFEINDSNCLTSSKLETEIGNETAHGHSSSVNGLSQSMERLDAASDRPRHDVRKLCASSDNLKANELGDHDGAGGCCGGGDSLDCSDSMLSVSGSRNSLLKRKGICSSQEMLHLVDLMNDNISAEQVDVLAKSLIELGSTSDSLEAIEPTSIAASVLPDPDALLESFPETIDEKLLENIDAAIYENQIIFQERIRKNQLTIHNLKLQDQLLSKCIEDFKINPTLNDTLSIRDYENMCFSNVALNERGMKHWRNYLQDMDTNVHDNSTVQHSSFYQNTTAAFSQPDELYINENDLAAPTSTQAEYRFGCGHRSKPSDLRTGTELAHTADNGNALMPCYKKIVQWQTSKVPSLADASKVSKCSCDEDSSTENYYMVMTKQTIPTDAGEKNILVETINKINIVDSPIKSLMSSDAIKPI